MRKNTLKEDFKNWLANQGYQSKTAAGRASTTNEYALCLDNLCKKLFKGKTEQAWEELVNYIDVILGFYTLCHRGNFYIKSEHFDEIKSFLINYINFVCVHETVENYLKIVKFGAEANYPSSIIKVLIEQGLIVDVELNIADSQNRQKKEARILKKFLCFLKDEEKKKAKSLKRLDNKYKKIDAVIASLKQTEQFYNIYAVKTIAGNGKNPPQLEAEKENEITVGSKWAAGLCHISLRTLKRLTDKGVFHTVNNQYDIKELNAYINNKYEDCRDLSLGGSYKEWWDVNKVKNNTGLTEKQLQRLRYQKKVRFINPSARKYVYYPADVKKYSKK